MTAPWCSATEVPLVDVRGLRLAGSRSGLRRGGAARASSAWPPWHRSKREAHSQNYRPVTVTAKYGLNSRVAGGKLANGLVDGVTRLDPEALLDPGTSLDLPASKLLSLRLPPPPSGLRLGLAPSLPVGAGCLHVAVGAPGGEPVAAASIRAKFLKTLHLPALSASLHVSALLTVFFTFSRGKRAGCHIASSLKNRPLVLDDRMAPLAQREQVVERRETAFASGNDVMDVQRGRAHGRPAALARVPVTLQGRRPSS
jgi:hypothetical protein